MLQSGQILVRAIALVVVAGASAAGLSACGQTGPLYLPTEPAAARRATLPEILLPGARPGDTVTQPAAPASTPSSSTRP